MLIERNSQILISTTFLGLHSYFYNNLILYQKFPLAHRINPSSSIYNLTSQGSSHSPYRTITTPSSQSHDLSTRNRILQPYPTPSRTLPHILPPNPQESLSLSIIPDLTRITSISKHPSSSFQAHFKPISKRTQINRHRIRTTIANTFPCLCNMPSYPFPSKTIGGLI